ncbi:uncharacterized protein LOC108086965 [Drosophila ficusphila]|uniref:uncharacterized protein LOC108086965 n=1 Tax=Drosophila ficusphila TaxID=30025 RepID=UPI0007E66555|nr:uncharacterized protein LOC108086965 [Drosophila ficusphila]
MAKTTTAASKWPVFISHSAQYNFLREYFLGCGDISPMTLIEEAASAWQHLSPQDRALFEEEAYLPARFGQLSDWAIRQSIDVLSAEQTTVRHIPSKSSKKSRSGNAKSRRKKKQQKRSAASKKRCPVFRN